ncbi:GtrA family protein [Candidatus Berkelbacteria bacterium]|nr:GtrA family protein [Candidatus Berkelbacteria bacterium]
MVGQTIPPPASSPAGNDPPASVIDLSVAAHQAARQLVPNQTVRQFTKYVLSGLVTFALDIGTTNLLVFSLDVPAVEAGYVGILVALTNGFVMNRWWTFRAANGHLAPQALRFLATASVGGILNGVVYTLLLTHWPIHFNLAKILAGAVGAAWNFTLMKVWVFPPTTRRVSSV